MTPAERVSTLAAAFERIARTRMAGLPLLNPHLQVDAVGFVSWMDVQVGVLVTPWAMNLVVLADDAEALRLGSDVRRRWTFPSGEYEMMGGVEAECGCFQFCPLFSPVFEFSDQTAAVATAQGVMDALFRCADIDQRETARLAGTSVLKAPTSRRRFLTGIFGAANA